MSNLRAEIDEMQDELERANDLDNEVSRSSYSLLPPAVPAAAPY